MGWAKYKYLTLPEVFSDKVIPDIDFTIVQCDVPFEKVFL